MSIVVADTGPIHYLILVNAAVVLGALFDKVYIPDAVYSELSHTSTPEPVKQWLSSVPAWLQTKPVTSSSFAPGIELGEQEAICLAEEIAADAVLIDDRKARLVAQERGLVVTGTVGVLTLAAKRGLVNLSEVFEGLKQTNFHIAPALLDAVLKEQNLR